jgi:hypothetical protein
MPQLWIETWVGQYFWLLVILFCFHFYMVNSVIPTIATILKIRKTLGAKEDATIENTGKENNDLKITLPAASVKAVSITNFASARANWIKNNS